MSETLGSDGLPTNTRWMQHDGRGCPVRPHDVVAVKWRSGNRFAGEASGFQWHWRRGEPLDYDILEYARLHAAPNPA